MYALMKCYAQLNCVVVLFLTVKRQLETDEDLSCVVDFWGKSRVRLMKSSIYATKWHQKAFLLCVRAVCMNVCDSVNVLITRSILDYACII